MYTVDASVWVNAFDQREPGHEISRNFLNHLKDKALPVVLPNLVLAEVGGALSRTRKKPEQALAFATALGRLPHVTLQPLDDRLAHQALDLAARYSLRGADAIYAAVALHVGYELISLDNEHLTRLVGVVKVRTPANVMTLFQGTPSS